MGGLRKELRDQAGEKPPKVPLAFAQGGHVYASHLRRRRHRRYRLLAVLLTLAVGTGIVAVLLANWLNILVK
jgi:hypothetical protein